MSPVKQHLDAYLLGCACGLIQRFFFIQEKKTNNDDVYGRTFLWVHWCNL